MEPASRPPERVHALDGLRGIAALVVVLHHSLLTVPALSLAYDPGVGRVERGSFAWWSTYSPLHLLWAGAESVVLFFVLSGYVLARPSATGVRVQWHRYYPRRILRLYAPTAAAVVLAVASVFVVTRVQDSRMSGWLLARPVGVAPDAIRDDLLLLRRPGGYLSVLWSLQWELVFSLALPVFLLIGRRTRRHGRLAAAAMLLVAFAAAHRAPGAGIGDGLVTRALWHLPMFGIGVLLAYHEPAVRRHLRRIPPTRVGAWSLGVTIAGLLSARWLLLATREPFPTADLHGPLAAWSGIAIITGAALLVAVSLERSSLRRALGARSLRWLGSRSFSLYLVHEPVVVSVAYLLGPVSRPVLQVAVGVPLSLLLAEIFHRGVERPVMRAIAAPTRDAVVPTPPAEVGAVAGRG